MKIWLAYKFRGADLETLKKQLNELVVLLENNGHEVVTMISNIQGWNLDTNVLSKSEAVRQAYALCKQCDVALCLFPTDDSSEGRGWDAGYFAGMGKPTIMAIEQSLSIPYTEALFSENPANKEWNLPSIIRYTTFKDIANSFPVSTD